MNDYEEKILARQESEADECAGCEHLEICRHLTKGTFNPCLAEHENEPLFK